MKKELPNKYDAYAKVMRVIRSCETLEQCTVARKMIANFLKIFNINDYYPLENFSFCIPDNFSKYLDKEIFLVEEKIVLKK